jgi:hypothetical protein
VRVEWITNLTWTYHWQGWFHQFKSNGLGHILNQFEVTLLSCVYYHIVASLDDGL